MLAVANSHVHTQTRHYTLHQARRNANVAVKIETNPPASGAWCLFAVPNNAGVMVTPVGAGAGERAGASAGAGAVQVQVREREQARDWEYQARGREQGQ
jgi:hypothetical protein